MTVSIRSVLCCLAILALSGKPAGAAPADPYDVNWHFSLTPYLWLAASDADLNFSIPPGGNTDVHSSASDIFKALHFAFMGTADARRGNWSIFTDYMYVSLGDDHARLKTITGPNGNVEFPVTLGTKVTLKDQVWTLAGAYSVLHGTDTSLDLFAGFRYLGARSKLNWSLAGPSGLLSQSGQAVRGAYLWDAIVGVKGRYGFAATRWYIPYYLDLGGGDSNFTWQAATGFGYRLGWGDVSLIYRYLSYHPSDSKLIEKLSLHGPALAVTFHL